MDQTALQLIAILGAAVFVLDSCSGHQLADIAFPCNRDSAPVLIFKALDYVCIGNKKDPIFEKFLNENSVKREKRESKLLNALSASIVQQQKEGPLRISENAEGSSQENSPETDLLIQSFLSHLKSVSSETNRRIKREEKEEEEEEEGMNLMDKIMHCCEFSHMVRTSCTLQDLKPYCWDYLH